MADTFNKPFPPKAISELDRRSNLPKDWMYRKYATISITTTGNTSTVICSEAGFTIGDKVETEGPLSLYTTETGTAGSIRKFKPTLKSVKITNNGGQDYTDAYLYEIEASFTVFTLDDINKVERSYFRVGAEIEISFGWKGFTDEYNSGKIVAAIYEFSFQMQPDGSYDCTIKAMSAASIFGSDRTGGDKRTDSLGLLPDTTGPNKPITNFAEAFLLMAKQAFGIKASDTDLKVSGLADNTMKVETFSAADGNKYKFAALELEEPSGFFDTLLGGNDTTILYTTLKSLIDYINTANDKSSGGFEVVLQKGTNSEYKLSPASWKDIGSANPFKVLIPDASDYGDGLKLTSVINSVDATATDFGKILINISEIVRIYNDLYGNQSTAKTAKAAPKISDFLGKVFEMISDATGGITRLQTRPVEVDLDSKSNGVANDGTKLKVEIINRSMIPSVGISNIPYPFKVLDQSSIIRSISLQSDFTTDFLIAATPKAIKDGNTPNKAGILSLYSGCAGIEEKLTTDDTQVVKKEDIVSLKTDIGDNGWDDAKSGTLTDIIRKYINQESATTAEGSYSEIPFLLDLSITIDGIHNIPYMAPITVDRLPDRFKSSEGNSIIEFAITSIEHSFDGQGDWETTFGTVMRIK
jgi:hypothetical protein